MPQNGRRTRYDDSNWMQEFLDIMDNGGLEKYQARMARTGRNAPALPGSRPVADVPARNDRGTSSADGNWMQEFLDIMDNGGLEKYQANMARRNNPNASGRSGEWPATAGRTIAASPPGRLNPTPPCPTTSSACGRWMIPGSEKDTGIISTCVNSIRNIAISGQRRREFRHDERGGRHAGQAETDPAV